MGWNAVPGEFVSHVCPWRARSLTEKCLSDRPPNHHWYLGRRWFCAGADPAMARGEESLGEKDVMPFRCLHDSRCLLAHATQAYNKDFYQRALLRRDWYLHREEETISMSESRMSWFHARALAVWFECSHALFQASDAVKEQNCAKFDRASITL